MRSTALLVLLVSFNVPTASAEPSRTTSSTPTAQLAANIAKQLEWFGQEPVLAREFLGAVATMNYVQQRVSPLRYAGLKKAGKPLPTNADEYLSMGAGICGGQVMTARTVLTHLGIRNRPVAFYLHGESLAENQSHIGLEVWYDEGWHFFDITWGTFFRRPERPDDVLSIGEVLRTTKVMKLALVNESDLWFQQWKASGHDPFAYIAAAAERRDVIVGRKGTIRLRRPKGLGDYVPTHQPNYVGRNKTGHGFGSQDIQLLHVSDKARHCFIKVLGVAGTGKLKVRGKARSVTTSLAEIKPGELKLDIAGLVDDGRLTITIENKSDEIGYLVFERIRVSPPQRIHSR